MSLGVQSVGPFAHRSDASYAVRVPRARALPMASVPPPITRTQLPHRLGVPVIKAPRGLSPPSLPGSLSLLGYPAPNYGAARHAWRTNRKGREALRPGLSCMSVGAVYARTLFSVMTEYSPTRRRGRHLQSLLSEGSLRHLQIRAPIQLLRSQVRQAQPAANPMLQSHRRGRLGCRLWR